MSFINEIGMAMMTMGYTFDGTMMTPSNGNIFRVSDALWGESTDHRWISLTRPVARSFDVFFDLHLTKRLRRRWFETSSGSFWHHFNDFIYDHNMEYRVFFVISPNKLFTTSRDGSWIHGYFLSMEQKARAYIFHYKIQNLNLNYNSHK